MKNDEVLHHLKSLDCKKLLGLFACFCFAYHNNYQFIEIKDTILLEKSKCFSAAEIITE